MILLDTHAWIWSVTGDATLNETARREIVAAEAAQQLYLCPISLWEIALKHSRGKLDLDRPLRSWLRTALALSGVQLTMLDSDVAVSCAELPAAFHGDPADRLIAATARVEGLQLVTHDKRLLALAKAGHFRAIPT